ncbi:hypothetical protein Aph02nite_12650 [Actinoplanes philippinensis]|uniref:Uncharacterized protein n=1 Tax=Actinoplanes philippinensis TaxID=35752 RepID=A0A1I1ZSL8_9ACTN|nr:hypothetical protein [Actinoplanes philippinensis]GIE75315.1 hypothetical protein Aph02nite_12650 [Actinoplanes philippinensis]SFE34592.1 hypothetical protein SAMN05421541_101273 [Actinoplanes philippinensis]
MNEHGDRLREAFTKHETETPDPAAVYARVEELAKKYRWRRFGVQAAGGVALSAGLIAGITQLPAILPASPAATNAPAFEVAAPIATIDPAAPLTDEETKAGLAAYFEAGFGYDNAVELAKLWNLPGDQIAQVKAVAGRKLLANETLPVTAKPNTDEPTTGEPEDTELSRQTEEFFLQGYDWDDAVVLAKLWKLDDPGSAKAEAGKRLLAGETLPGGVKPDPKQVEEGNKARLANVFWDAGYDGEDAEKLAKLWKLDDTYDAKVEAGRRIQAGETLPIQP